MSSDFQPEILNASNYVLARLNKKDLLEIRSTDDYFLEFLADIDDNNLLIISATFNNQETFDFLINYFCNNYIENEILPNYEKVFTKFTTLITKLVKVAKLNNNFYFVKKTFDHALDYLDINYYLQLLSNLSKINISLEKTINNRKKIAKDFKQKTLDEIISNPKFKIKEFLEKKIKLYYKLPLILIRDEAIRRNIDKEIIINYFLIYELSRKWFEILLPVLNKNDYNYEFYVKSGLIISTSQVKPQIKQLVEDFYDYKITLEQLIILRDDNNLKYILKNSMDDAKIEQYISLFDYFKNCSVKFSINSSLGWILLDTFDLTYSITEFKKIVKFLTTKTNKKIITYLKSHIENMVNYNYSKPILIELLENLS